MWNQEQSGLSIQRTSFLMADSFDKIIYELLKVSYILEVCRKHSNIGWLDGSVTQETHIQLLEKKFILW